MTANIIELCFDEKSYNRLSDFLEDDYIASMRKNYRTDCVTVAENLARHLMDSGYLATVVMFKGRNMLQGIRVNDYLTDCISPVYTHHAVVLTGDCVIDLLHSDTVIKTADYVRGLQEINDYVRVDEMMSSWYGEDGYPCIPTIEDLLKL